jgi:hypothetical protein
MSKTRFYLLVLISVAICDRWANWHHSWLRWMTGAAFAVVWAMVYVIASRSRGARRRSRLEKRAYDSIPGETVAERSAAVHQMIDHIEQDEEPI